MRDYLMYGLPDDFPTGFQTCRSFESFNLLKPTGYVMHQQFNILKPTGYVIHQQFNIQQL